MVPSFPPQISDNLGYLQAQVNRGNLARPGPMSWGPDDGHIRFYAADGRVLFQANSTGASVESRSQLTGLTPLLDSIRDKNDQQDGRLDGHDSDVKRIDAKNAQQDGRLSSAEGRLGKAENRLDGHDSTLSSHNSRINTAQARADKGVSDAASAQSRADSAYSRAGSALSAAATAQSRADSAYSRAGSGVSDAASARARADAAYSLAQGRATQSQIDSLTSKFAKLVRRIDSIEARVVKIENQIRQ